MPGAMPPWGRTILKGFQHVAKLVLGFSMEKPMSSMILRCKGVRGF